MWKYIHVDRTLEVYSFANHLGFAEIPSCQPKLSKFNRKQTNRDKGMKIGPIKIPLAC